MLQFPTTTHAQPAEDFDIRVERVNGAPRLFATGELDMLTAPLLARGLTELESPGSTITVDLAGLTFLDVAGIRVLWDGVEGSVDGGGSMSIVNCSDQIRRLFHLTGTEHLLWNDAESADRSRVVPAISAQPEGASLSLVPTP